MKRLIEDIKKFHKNEDGEIVQTAIITAILAAIAIGAYLFLGPKIKANFDKAGDALDQGSEYSY